MANSVSIVATGDSFVTQRLPRDKEALAPIRALLHEADVRFTNLEVSIHDFEVHPAAVSGGTWAAARPAVLSDLRWLGFNLLAWANNHTLDWSYGGLLKTYEHLENGNWVHAGVGTHLAEANQPRYLDTANGRVAIVAATSTCRDWHVAGEQRPDVLGRPGVNPLRYDAIHKVPQADLDKLKDIIDRTDVNAARALSQREGFSTAGEGAFYADNLHFEAGDGGTVTTMNQEDAERIARSIREAARQADVVLVSHHAHEMKGIDKAIPADFVQEFAHFCIDSGAHAFIGHGPHILRGIELYQNRPVFYSLGNFIFQNDTVERQPAEFYRLYSLGRTIRQQMRLMHGKCRERKGLPRTIRFLKRSWLRLTSRKVSYKSLCCTPSHWDLACRGRDVGNPLFRHVRSAKKYSPLCRVCQPRSEQGLPLRMAWASLTCHDAGNQPRILNRSLCST